MCEYRVGEKFAERLTNIMQDKRMSSRSLGRRTMIPVADVRKFKTGELIPDVADFSALLWALECTPEDLDSYWDEY